MNTEEEIRNQIGKLQNELYKIRQEELQENRRNYVGKYFCRYIDDDNNRYQYFCIEKIFDGNLFGWWFTVGDTFTKEFSISSETVPLSYVADDNYHSSSHNMLYNEISEAKFYQRFQMLLNCVDARVFVKKIK